MSAPARRGGRPTVGMVSAWYDITDPKEWSGVPRNLLDGMARLGVHTTVRNTTPWPVAADAIHKWMEWTNRLDETWTLRIEMRALTAVSNAYFRARTPAHVDGWIQPAAGIGRGVRGRVVTLSEMSPSQLEEAGPALAGSFGYPDATPRRLATAARQQVSAHRYAAACCVASRWAGDSLVRDHGIDPARVHVVGYGRNADLAAPPARDWSTPRFLFVGRDWARKNGDAVVRAFRRLRDEHPAATLDVVGGHPPLDEDGVTGHGALAVHDPEGRRRIEALFSSATCFVMPSFIEPFGIVYLEAAAAGLPSIAGNVGGTVDSVGAGGVLVDPADEGALFDAMTRLARGDEARRLGDVAARRAGWFSWDQFAARVLRSLELPGMEDVELSDYLDERLAAEDRANPR